MASTNADAFGRFMATALKPLPVEQSHLHTDTTAPGREPPARSTMTREQQLHCIAACLDTATRMLAQLRQEGA